VLGHEGAAPKLAGEEFHALAARAAAG
jgi:hypothetical protein